MQGSKDCLSRGIHESCTVDMWPIVQMLQPVPASNLRQQGPWRRWFFVVSIVSWQTRRKCAQANWLQPFDWKKSLQQVLLVFDCYGNFQDSLRALHLVWWLPHLSWWWPNSSSREVQLCRMPLAQSMQKSDGILSSYFGTARSFAK